MVKVAKQNELDAIKEKIATDRAVGRLYAKTPLDDTQAVIFNGELKTVLVRKPLDDQKCIIDWINFVLDAKPFYSTNNELNTLQQEAFAVRQVAKQLLRIIGFGLDMENSSGRNFYRRSFSLEHNAGFICIGGQNDTMLVCINGTGCTYANIEWELALFNWLKKLTAHITRIDLAHDVLEKSFLTVDLFDKIHSKAGFNKGGRNPEIEYRGNWKASNGKGRTLYVGSRQSSKFCRIYEKGKQLGDPNSSWLRIEVEFKSRDIYIPLPVLLNPTDYFIAAYPCFFLIAENDFFDRFETREQNELLTFDKALDIVKKQYGRYLYFFRQCYQDDTMLLDDLTNITNKNPPERLDLLTIPKNLTPPKGI